MWILDRQQFADPQQERLFRDEFALKSRDSVSILIAIAAVVWIGWAFFDYHLPDHLRDKMLAVRFGVTGPILVGLLLCSRSLRLLKYQQLFIRATFGCLVLGFVAIAHFYEINYVSRSIFGIDSGMEEAISSYVQIVVWLFIAFTCIGMANSLYATAAVNSVVFVLVNIYMAFHFNVPVPVLAIGAAMCSVNVFSSLFTGYQNEKKAREIFVANQQVKVERERSEALLLNVLPPQIAGRLKAQKTTIADAFDNVSVLFADIAGFTPLSAQTTPAEIVGMLNRIFVEFDRIARTHGAEKIKTIGDAYMVASGVPEHRLDHSRVIAECALDMVEVVAQQANPLGMPIQLRIGIHSGPAIAGVIGAHKFAYDLWGDTVNVASRMESSGSPGRIQVTAEIYMTLKDEYVFEERGPVQVKGKGMLNTWWLVGRRARQA